MAETNVQKNDGQEEKTVSKKAVEENSKKERTIARNKAFDTIKEFVDNAVKKDPDGAKEIVEAMKVIRPSLYGSTSGGGGGTSNPLRLQIISKIKESGKIGIHEDDLFKQFKVGRKEINAHYKTSLRKAKPANRIWVVFNSTNGVYSVVGEGETPPDSYKGWRPVEESVELK